MHRYRQRQSQITKRDIVQSYMVYEHGWGEPPRVHLGEHGQLALLVAGQGLDNIGSCDGCVVG
jgi:hypothetical protein